MHYTNYNDAGFKEAFFKLAEASEHIAITAHMSPDDDSIASVLSVYTILTTKYPNKTIRIVYPSAPSPRHSIFFNYDKIEFVEDITEHLSGVDLFILLDASRYARVSVKHEELAAIPIANKILIDHHASPPDSFTLGLIMPECTSNAELIYRALGAESMLTKELAEHFLLGILGDTGSFAFVPPEQVKVFDVAKKLISIADTSIGTFRSRYGGIPKRIVPLMQMLVQNMRYENVSGWPDVQVTYIDRNMMEEGGYTDEDISAASHIFISQYITRIEGYPWGMVATPREDGSGRVSARSLEGSVNVRELFERIGIGGGHDRAAGSYIVKEGVRMDGADCLNIILAWMKEHPLV